MAGHRPLRISKSQFIARLERAVTGRFGFAAGKIGQSERHVLYEPVARTESRQPRRARAYGLAMKFHASNQALFPTNLDFCDRFRRFYVERVRGLDALGLFGAPTEARLIAHYGLDTPVMDYRDQEPDRSSPDNPALCYLPLFRGKRVLIVTSQADVLCARASGPTFEAVWQKTGKRWFYPSAVDALSFPFGWAPATQKRFPDSLALFADVASRMATRDFDVALIAAGGLGIPLAMHAKSLGRVGLSLGGHLQALFGVIGKRWRENEDWVRDYVTPDWIDMPDDRREWAVTGSDGGAYW